MLAARVLAPALVFIASAWVDYGQTLANGAQQVDRTVRSRTSTRPLRRCDRRIAAPDYLNEFYRGLVGEDSAVTLVLYRADGALLSATNAPQPANGGARWHAARQSKRRRASRSAWRPWPSSPAAWRTTSITCS